MAPVLRIVTTPVRLAGDLRLAHLVGLVSVDALVRWETARGTSVCWEPATMVGDLASQHAVERELAREGVDRATMGREGFVDRVRAFEADRRARLAEQLSALRIGAQLDVAGLDSDAAGLAARTAFVRLFEEGLLELAERVVDVCPQCDTVVDRADSEDAVVRTDRLTLSVPLDDGTLAVRVSSPELLAGAVAIAVPEGDPTAGQVAEVPLAGRRVPVVVEPGLDEPTIVVPAHDAAALDIARRLGLTAAAVLDSEGTVAVDGPLAGLGRYAARAAARELLEAEGSLVAAEPIDEAARRCRRCGTVLVPILGQHWFLAAEGMEEAAADAIREGTVTFTPAAARDAFVAAAGASGPWCLSHQVWAGQPVPVAVCQECGQAAVLAGDTDSCGKCMGELVQVDDVLDARFVGAVWALAASGGTASETGPAESAATTRLVTSPTGVCTWALPMAALALRLAGTVPFSSVAVHHVAEVETDLDPALPVDLDAVLATEEVGVVRAALVAGGLDLDAARALVAAIDSPPAGGADVDALEQAVAAAFDAGVPDVALRLIGAAVDDGVPAAAASRLRDLAAPILGS